MSIPSALRAPLLVLANLIVLAGVAAGPLPAATLLRDVDEDERGPLVVTRRAMGVQFQIALLGDDDAALEALAERALAEVDRLEGLFNNWDPESAISRLNARPGTEPVDVDPELAALLRAALSMAERTGGAYDVTIGPAIRAFALDEETPRAPTAEERAAALSRVGPGKLAVALDPPRVRRAVAGMEIDVSSGAKGYAVDRVARLLDEAGIGSFFVTAGGSTVFARGAGPEGEGWPLVVDATTTWRLRDEAVSTSGRSFRDRELEGERLGHIFDPRTGAPVARGIERALFRGPSAFEADMASTALVVLGTEGARRWFGWDPALVGCTARLEPEGGAPVELGAGAAAGRPTSVQPSESK